MSHHDTYNDTIIESFIEQEKPFQRCYVDVVTAAVNNEHVNGNQFKNSKLRFETLNQKHINDSISKMRFKILSRIVSSRTSNLHNTVY